MVIPVFVLLFSLSTWFIWKDVQRLIRIRKSTKIIFRKIPSWKALDEEVALWRAIDKIRGALNNIEGYFVPGAIFTVVTCIFFAAQMENYMSEFLGIVISSSMCLSGTFWMWAHKAITENPYAKIWDKWEKAGKPDPA